jgi:cytidylate kinase
MKRITIAIDGHSSTGKSTLAKQLATKLGYSYIDTGAMYRGVTVYGMRNGWVTEMGIDVPALVASLPKITLDFCFDARAQCSEMHLNGENIEQEIRSMAVSSKVSKVSQLVEVRKFLVQQQQEMGATKGVVLDGRDIGTVVFPNAELKIYMTASAEVRAKRRFDELQSKGQDGTFNEVLENLKQRDYDDTNRAESPLKRAEDAKILDNSTIDRVSQLDLVLSWAKENIG